MKRIALLAAWICACGSYFNSAAAQEFTPPQGKGRGVLVVSGSMGAGAYEPAAKRIAAMGYDVLLLNSKDMVGDHGAGIRAGIDKLQHSGNMLPGKVGVVGFSLGGGQALAFATSQSDTVAVVVVMYPLTRLFTDHIPAVVGRIQMPVLMLAGEADSYKDCCKIETARAIGAAAQAAGKPLELVTYPGADHDFVVESNRNYDAKSAADAWQRTESKLKQYLPN
ncbi:MAG TPA: dienelactone hydrolase family protein [Steroidobacteraceae bacterium]|nr:dienelactone hydrolase family protein [Steroidobacteraceae bacterium]